MKTALRLCVGLLVIGLAVPPLGVAQDFGTKGQTELGGSIGYSSATPVSDGETGDAATAFSVNPYIGYFVIDQLELGLMPQYTRASQGDMSVSSFTILFAPAWNFKIQNSPVTPFLEGLIGYGSNNVTIDDLQIDQTESGISYGGRAGMKIAVTGNGLLNVGLEYLLDTRNPEDWEGDRNGSNTLSVIVGFTVFFD